MFRAGKQMADGLNFRQGQEGEQRAWLFHHGCDCSVTMAMGELGDRLLQTLNKQGTGTFKHLPETTACIHLSVWKAA